MVACPNKSSKEWVNLVNKIGLKEAFREYMIKGDGSIPDAENYPESFNGVNSSIKIIDALSSPKTEQLFNRFFKSNPEKFYSELTQLAGKNQVELLKNWAADKDIMSPIDMITGMLANASFVIEINTEFAVEKEQEIAENIVLTLADRLMTNFGISYNMITAEEARQLSDKWNGEGAFYLNGKVYIVEGHFTMENVLHEYSHPLIDAIYSGNKTLFNNLNKSILATPEGQTIVEDVKRLYPEYDENSPAFIKEVMTRALTAEAMSEKTSKGFKDIISKILFAIKQALRKVFGVKVKVDKLNVNTSLQDLAKMLKGDKFDINTEITSEKDAIQFNRAASEFTESFKNVKDNDISIVVQRFYDLTKNQIRRVIQNKNYTEARKLLVDEAGKGVLQGIKATLDETEINEKLFERLNEVEARERNTTYLVHSFIQLDTLTSKIEDHVSDMLNNSSINSKEVVSDLFYYDLLIRNWDSFIDETNTRLFDNGMKTNSQLGQMLSSIRSRIDKIKRDMSKAYTPGVIEALKESLAPAMEGIKNQYDARIEELEKKRAPKKEIEDVKAEYKKFEITDEKLRQILMGETTDTNVFSAYFEAFTNSPDIVVGGFAMFLKNNYSVVEVQFQREMNDFVRDILPLLDAAGYSRTNYTKLMKKLVFIDKSLKFDIEKGEAVENENWTFLNPFKNVNLNLQKFKNDLEAAKEKGDKAEMDKIIRMQNKHLRDYFYQKYVNEFYEKEKIYESIDTNADLKKLTYEVLGIDLATATNEEKEQARQFYLEASGEIYRKKQYILSDIKAKEALKYDEKFYNEYSEEKKLLWREYSRIASPVDDFGEPKTGKEKLMAAIEKTYRKESNKFYEWVPIPGQFEFALKKFEQELTSKHPVGSQEYTEKRDKWIKDNTVIAYTREFYDERNKILLRLKELMERVDPSIRSKIDSSVEIEQMLSLSVGFRDAHGQVIGIDMPQKSIDKVIELQKAIVAKKDSMATFSGLTKDEMQELSQLYQKSNGGRNMSEADRIIWDSLLNKKDRLGVDKATRAEISRCYAELTQLQSKEATDYYVDILNNWLTSMGEGIVDNETANDVLQPEGWVNLFAKSEDFQNWFEKNHIRKEVFDPENPGQTKIVYERAFIWNRTRPNSENHYEKTTLTTGEVIPAKPNLSYYRRVVIDDFSKLNRLKEKTDLTIDEQEQLDKLLEKERTGSLVSYKTQKIVGKTIDNKGNWLPKTVADGAKSDTPYINEAYEKLRREDPNAFKLLEKMKESHLKFQEDVPIESRLYLEIPRYRTHTQEILTKSKSKDWFTKFRLNLRSAFIKSNDDYADGLNYNAPKIVSANMFDEEIRKVPVTGKYNLKPEEVSMNILDGIMQYRNSLLHQKKLIELNPVAQALQTILEDPRNAVNTGKISKFFMKMFKKQVPIKEKDNSVRSKAVKNLYEREFEGVYQTAFLVNTIPAIHKWRMIMSKVASLGYFGLNFPSAFKNKIAAQEQQLIEAAGGRWLNLSSLAIGKLRSGKMLGLIAANTYKTGLKPLDVQLVQIFNPIPDFYEETVRSQFGRSLYSDFADLSILTNHRKFLQNKATLDLFAGMMVHQKVTQTINGTSKKINYIDAFELRNGQIELKEGIDKEWAPGGKKFNATKAKIQELRNRLEGTYAKFDQPELARHFYYQATMFMKKYFTSMLMNHVAGTRVSVGLGEVTTGTYASFLKMLQKVWRYRSLGYLTRMSNEEQTSVKKIAAQIISMVVLNILFNEIILGVDDDDDDMVEKMKAKSGDLGADNFDALGWYQNQMLVVSMGVVTETGTWYNPQIFANTIASIPVPPILDAGLIAPFNILNHTYGAAIGDETAFYKKDAGPYPWQKKGGSKALKELADMFGLTGSTVSPVKAAKGIKAQRRGIFR